MFKTLESFTASPHCVHTGLWNIRGGMLRKPLKYLLSLLLIITAATRCFAVDDVTLDVTKSASDNSNFTSASGKTVNITVTGRTYTANQWDGLCLPFNVSREQLDGVFGSGKYDIRKLKSVDKCKFTFRKLAEDEGISGNEPYLIRTTTDFTGNMAFSNVTILEDVKKDNPFVIHSLCSSSETAKLKGHYYKIDAYLFEESNNANEPWIFYSGTLINNGDWNNFESRRQMGCNIHIIVYNDHNTKPSLLDEEGNDILTSSSSGSGSEEGGESGGSDTNSLDYKIKNRMQLTDVPTIYITLPDIGDTPLSDYLYKTVTNGVEDAPYRAAKIQVVSNDATSANHIEPFIEESDKLKMKVRGNSTAKVSNGKKPYRLKFAKDEKDAQGNLIASHKHDLGLGYKKRNWTLLANAFDHSMIRNAISYHICKEVGLPFAAGYRFIDLVINDEYRGTYQVSDHLEVDKKRINIDEDTGWYVEFQGRGDMLDYPNIQSTGYLMNVKNPDTDGLTEEETTSLLNVIKDWFDDKWKPSLDGYNVDASDVDEGWRAYNDEQTLMDFLIATDITGDYDGLMTVKAYRDLDTKLFWGPVWDKDLAIGNYDNSNDEKLVMDIGNASSISSYVQNIMKDPLFTKKIAEKMKTLYDGGLYTRLSNNIDDIVNGIKKTWALNYEKWGDASLGMETQYNLGKLDTYVANIKEWLKKRIKFVNDKYTSIANEYATKSTEDFTYDTSKPSYGNGIYGNTGKILDVTMTNRSFTSNAYNSLCVPFSITAEQMEATFGEGYELRELTDISNDGSTLYFTIPADNAVVAARPYIVKPTKVVESSPVFSDVVLYNASKTRNGKEKVLGDYTFKGNLFTSSLNSGSTIYEIGSDGKAKTKVIGNNEAAAGSTAYITSTNETVPVIVFGEKTGLLTLDANATEEEVKTALQQFVGQNVSIKLANRTFSKDYYNTLTLPFDVEETQIKNIFGESVDIEEYYSMDGTTLHFKTSNDIKTGVPYLIKPTEDVVEPTFTNVILGNLSNGSTVTFNNYSFVPNLFPTTLSNDKTDIYFGIDGKLHYPSASNFMLFGTRAYLKFPQGVSAKIAFNEDVVSHIITTPDNGINTIHTIYNLNGQRMTKSVSSLPKGIYIINGTKKIVK